MVEYELITITSSCEDVQELRKTVTNAIRHRCGEVLWDTHDSKKIQHYLTALVVFKNGSAGVDSLAKFLQSYPGIRQFYTILVNKNPRGAI